uniref:Secreted protein n=1 Tax=Triticum urartu TaxID=4572 RepID=A0A8R7UGM2_TRIUA
HASPNYAAAAATAALLRCCLGVVVCHSPPLDGWRLSAPKCRPCSGACTPPALPHPTLRHHLPYPELRFTTPTAFQFELRLDLIPAATVFPEPRKPSSDTLSSAACFSNHWYVTVVQSGRWLLQSWRRRSGGSIPAASGEHTASTCSKQSRPMM